MPLTDQAILKIKDLIIAGEFGAGAKLPRERDLAARLGLSRNSLREAVRALALIGVLDTRVGDGTYVTSLDADMLLTGMGFVGDLLEGSNPARGAPGPPHPRARRDRARCHTADRGRLPRPRGVPPADGRSRRQPGVHRRRHRVPSDHRLRIGQRNARVGDPEPLRRDDARPPLAHDHRARRRSRSPTSVIATSTSPSAPAMRNRRAPRTSCIWPTGSAGCSKRWHGDGAFARRTGEEP